jgi:hypothetical protein
LGTSRTELWSYPGPEAHCSQVRESFMGDGVKTRVDIHEDAYMPRTFRWSTGTHDEVGTNTHTCHLVGELIPGLLRKRAKIVMMTWSCTLGAFCDRCQPPRTTPICCTPQYMNNSILPIFHSVPLSLCDSQTTLRQIHLDEPGASAASPMLFRLQDACQNLTLEIHSSPAAVSRHVLFPTPSQAIL